MLQHHPNTLVLFAPCKRNTLATTRKIATSMLLCCVTKVIRTAWHFISSVNMYLYIFEQTVQRMMSGQPTMSHMPGYGYPAGVYGNKQLCSELPHASRTVSCAKHCKKYIYYDSTLYSYWLLLQHVHATSRHHNVKVYHNAQAKGSMRWLEQLSAEGEENRRKGLWS